MDQKQLPCNNCIQQTNNNNALESDISETDNMPTSNQDFDSIIDYNEDALLSLIDSAQDLNVLDEVYNKLQSEMQQKVGLLKKIKKENAEMKNDLDSHKSFLSEMENFENEKQMDTDFLREQIEVRRKKLKNIHNQQVDDLEKFESDICNLSEEIVNDAQRYESPALMEAIMEVQREVVQSKGEMARYKEQLEAAAQHFTQGVEDNSFTNTSLKTLEESISDISSLNEKLTQSVKQLTDKMDALRININRYSKP